MRRTKRKKQTLRGLRVETLERRNLLAFGGLRMFLSYSQDAMSANLATETKATIPAIVAAPAPIQTPVVVQSFAPVISTEVLAPPASVPAEAESTTVPAIRVTAAASQLSVLAETAMPNAASALDTLVVEAIDSSVSSGASLRSLITIPSDATVVPVLNDVPPVEAQGSLSDSVKVESIAEAVSTDSIATDSIAAESIAAESIAAESIAAESNVSVDNMGESESFIDTFALASVEFAYLPQTTVELNSGLEETSLAELDNGIGGDGVGGNEGPIESIESSNGSDDNSTVQVTGIGIDDTSTARVFDSFIDDGSVGDLDKGFDDNSSVHDSSEVNDFENGLDSESVDDRDNGLDDSIDMSDSINDGDDIALAGNDSLNDADLSSRLSESSASKELVGEERMGEEFGSKGDLDNGFDDVCGVFDGDYDGDDVAGSSIDDRGVSDVDNETHKSGSAGDMDDGNNAVVATVSGSSSATVNYGTWSASLVGSGTGNVVYQREGYESEFSARVFGSTPNATLDVVVGGVFVGQIRTNSKGSGRLKLENDDGRSMPMGFPVIGPTVAVEIGNSISGVFGQLSSESHD